LINQSISSDNETKEQVHLPARLQMFLLWFLTPMALKKKENTEYSKGLAGQYVKWYSYLA